MKYYVIEIATGDAKISGKSIGELETLNEAVALFHSKLGIAMKSDLYDSDLVMVVDGDGRVYRTEKWNKPVPEPVEEMNNEEVVE